MQDVLDIDICPETDIYGTYRRLSYTPWYAIAEFVDNSTQNYFDNVKVFEAESDFKGLEVSVTYDKVAGTLTIVDNAMGMNRAEMARAVRLNKPPADPSGRSEFGLGLKTAACWMGPRWTVVSKKLGETEELSVEIDIDKFKQNRPTSVSMNTRNVTRSRSHYTRVEISGLNEHNRKFVGRTLGKIKANLSSMYRRDLESGKVRLTFNDEALTYSFYDFLVTQEAGLAVEWKKRCRLKLMAFQSQVGWPSWLRAGKV